MAGNGKTAHAKARRAKNARAKGRKEQKKLETLKPKDLESSKQKKLEPVEQKSHDYRMTSVTLESFVYVAERPFASPNPKKVTQQLEESPRTVIPRPFAVKVQSTEADSTQTSSADPTPTTPLGLLRLPNAALNTIALPESTKSVEVTVTAPGGDEITTPVDFETEAATQAEPAPTTPLGLIRLTNDAINTISLPAQMNREQAVETIQHHEAVTTCAVSTPTTPLGLLQLPNASMHNFSLPRNLESERIVATTLHDDMISTPGAVGAESTNGSQTLVTPPGPLPLSGTALGTSILPLRLKYEQVAATAQGTKATFAVTPMEKDVEPAHSDPLSPSNQSTRSGSGISQDEDEEYSTAQSSPRSAILSFGTIVSKATAPVLPSVPRASTEKDAIVNSTALEMCSVVPPERMVFKDGSSVTAKKDNSVELSQSEADVVLGCMPVQEPRNDQSLFASPTALREAMNPLAVSPNDKTPSYTRHTASSLGRRTSSLPLSVSKDRPVTPNRQSLVTKGAASSTRSVSERQSLSVFYHSPSTALSSSKKKDSLSSASASPKTNSEGISITPEVKVPSYMRGTKASLMKTRDAEAVQGPRQAGQSRAGTAMSKLGRSVTFPASVVPLSFFSASAEEPNEAMAMLERAPKLLDEDGNIAIPKKMVMEDEDYKEPVLNLGDTKEQVGVVELQRGLDTSITAAKDEEEVTREDDRCVAFPDVNAANISKVRYPALFEREPIQPIDHDFSSDEQDEDEVPTSRGPSNWRPEPSTYTSHDSRHILKSAPLRIIEEEGMGPLQALTLVHKMSATLLGAASFTTFLDVLSKKSKATFKFDKRAISFAFVSCCLDKDGNGQGLQSVAYGNISDMFRRRSDNFIQAHAILGETSLAEFLAETKVDREETTITDVGLWEIWQKLAKRA